MMKQLELNFREPVYYWQDPDTGKKYRVRIRSLHSSRINSVDVVEAELLEDYSHDALRGTKWCPHKQHIITELPPLDFTTARPLNWDDMYDDEDIYPHYGNRR